MNADQQAPKPRFFPALAYAMFRILIGSTTWQHSEELQGFAAMIPARPEDKVKARHMSCAGVKTVTSHKSLIPGHDLHNQIQRFPRRFSSFAGCRERGGQNSTSHWREDVPSALIPETSMAEGRQDFGTGFSRLMIPAPSLMVRN